MFHYYILQYLMWFSIWNIKKLFINFFVCSFLSVNFRTRLKKTFYLNWLWSKKLLLKKIYIWDNYKSQIPHLLYSWHSNSDPKRLIGFLLKKYKHLNFSFIKFCCIYVFFSCLVLSRRFFFKNKKKTNKKWKAKISTLNGCYSFWDWSAI